MEYAREEHMPMLRWVARRARDRVRRGRIALLENPATSRAPKLDVLEELDGLDDGLIAEALFEYIIGEQTERAIFDGEPNIEAGCPHEILVVFELQAEISDSFTVSYD